MDSKAFGKIFDKTASSTDSDVSDFVAAMGKVAFTPAYGNRPQPQGQVPPPPPLQPVAQQGQPQRQPMAQPIPPVQHNAPVAAMGGTHVDPGLNQAAQTNQQHMGGGGMAFPNRAQQIAGAGSRPLAPVEARRDDYRDGGYHDDGGRDGGYRDGGGYRDDRGGGRDARDRGRDRGRGRGRGRQGGGGFTTQEGETYTKDPGTYRVGADQESQRSQAFAGAEGADARRAAAGTSQTQHQQEQMSMSPGARRRAMGGTQAEADREEAMHAERGGGANIHDLRQSLMDQGIDPETDPGFKAARRRFGTGARARDVVMQGARRRAVQAKGLLSTGIDEVADRAPAIAGAAGRGLRRVGQGIGSAAQNIGGRMGDWRDKRRAAKADARESQTSPDPMLEGEVAPRRDERSPVYRNKTQSRRERKVETARRQPDPDEGLVG